MSEKIIKSREEWKKIINGINDVNFQHLVYDLLRVLKFENIKERGGGADSGRDLEATYSYPRPNQEKRIIKCWLQCKKQNKGVSFGEIHEDITRATTSRVDEYYVLSNMDTTPSCKDEIKKAEETYFCKIVDWSGLKFQDILFQFPDICKYYFPDEEIPPVINTKDPGYALKLASDLGKRFGLDIEIDVPKTVNLFNPIEVADVLKYSLLKIQNIDINIKSLIYEKISMFFFALERHEDALMFLNNSLDITPKNIGALINKGYILEKIDKVEESNICYEEILKIDTKNKFALNNKAHNLMRIGKFEDSLACINMALEVDPNFVIAIHNKAEILKGLKKSKEALKYLEEKKELVDNSVSLQSTKVDLCIELLDLKEAYRINEQILNENSMLIEAINNKGVIYEKNSRFQNKEKYLNLALEWFEKVIQINNKYPIGWSNKVVVFLNSGKLEEAEKIINIAYTLFPKNPHVLNKKGVTLISKNPKEALKYFERALSLRFDEEFLLNKTQTQLILSHWKEAKESSEKLLGYNKEKSGAWNFKGIALKKLHQTALANSCFKNAEKYKEKPISLLDE